MNSTSDAPNNEDVSRHLEFLQHKTDLIEAIARCEESSTINKLWNALANAANKEKQATTHKPDAGYYEDVELDYHLSDYKKIKINLRDHQGRLLCYFLFDRHGDTPPPIELQIMGPDGDSQTFVHHNLYV